MVLTCTLYLSNSVYRLTTPRSSTAPTAPIIPTVFMGLTQICFGGTTIDDCQSIESFCAASVPPDAEQRIVDLICGGERVAMRGLVGAAMAVGGFAFMLFQILSWTRVLPIFRSTTSLEKLQRINTLFRTTVIFLATLHGLFLIVTGSLMLSLRGSFMDAMKGINGGVELYWGMYVCVGAVVVDAVFVPWYAYMQRRVFFVVRDGEGRFDPLDM
ncbi:hypothetical protein BC829DRAFT_398435 [Chytridium lagenaria]|nr:hypothetical protein BC829DRAFT_398435 [Chytridium lagenaria]